MQKIIKILIVLIVVGLLGYGEFIAEKRLRGDDSTLFYERILDLMRPKTQVGLGEKFILKKGEIAKLKNTTLTLKLVELRPLHPPCHYNILCPEGGNIYLIRDFLKEYQHPRDLEKAARYAIVKNESDYQTYAAFTFETSESFCKKQADSDSCFFHRGKDFSDPNLCRKVSDSVKNGECIRDTAHQLNQKQLCNEIPTPKLKYECMTGFVLRENDSSKCSEIDAEEYKQECLLKFVFGYNQKDKNPESQNLLTDACASLQPAYQADRCFSQLAKNTKQIDFCKKIGEPQDRGYCMINIAVNLGNREMCLEITDKDHSGQDMKETCLKKFE